MHTYATCIRITHQACHMNIYINIYMHGMHEEFSCSLSSFHKDLFLKYIPPSIWAADLPPDLALPDLYLGWLLGWKDMASLNQTTDFQGSPPPQTSTYHIYISNVAVFFFGGGGWVFNRLPSNDKKRLRWRSLVCRVRCEQTRKVPRLFRPRNASQGVRVQRVFRYGCAFFCWEFKKDLDKDISMISVLF